MITVFGGSGFIGSRLLKKLAEQNIDAFAPKRGEEWKSKELGDIIYCIGLTADFRTKPFETVEAHVCLLNEVLQHGQFNSLTYLSSTRVYIHCNEAEVTEESIIPVNVHDPSDLYTLTKLTGERICLSSGKKVKIARLSNVYGMSDTSENFLADITRQAKAGSLIRFQTAASSAKDYISINDVVSLLIRLAASDVTGIFNIASGVNTSNSEIVSTLMSKYSFEHEYAPDAPSIIFPKININRIKKELSYSAGNITADLINQ